VSLAGRPDGKRPSRRRDVGLEAARRFKEILKGGSSPERPLPPTLPPPQFPDVEEKRPLRFLRRPADDERDE
jgi:hypothetical protein